MDSTASAMSISSIDGLALEAVVHRPGDNRRPGAILLVHGITVDLNEGAGMFTRLAERLARQGFTVLRFSFRGHGGSGGTQRGVTIAGEMLDLSAAVQQVAIEDAGPLSLVAASFGAVPVLLSLPGLENQLTGIVLWNPVLDLGRTFLRPELPWGLENFSASAQDRLRTTGGLLVDGEFELGQTIFTEFAHYDPATSFIQSRVPALIIHGDRDSAVSYEIARETAGKRGDCDFHTVAGSDHGYDSREREDEAITATVDWLLHLYR